MRGHSRWVRERERERLCGFLSPERPKILYEGTLTLSHTATLQQISDSTLAHHCAHICLCVSLCLLTRPSFSLNPQSFLFHHPPIYPHFLSVCVCLSHSVCPCRPWRGINDSHHSGTLQHITTGQVGHLDTMSHTYTHRRTQTHIAYHSIIKWPQNNSTVCYTCSIKPSVQYKTYNSSQSMNTRGLFVRRWEK